MTVPSFATIRPRTIIVVALLVCLVLVSSAFIELRQSTDEIYHLLTEEALSLAETIDRGSANILLSAELIEQLVLERLVDNANLVARLDSLRPLRRDDLVAIASGNDLYRINVFDRRGKKTLSNHTEEPGHRDLIADAERTELLRPLLQGTQSLVVLGMRPAPVPDEFRYAVGVRRTRPGGGAIVVNIDAERFLEFRRRVGVGKLISDLGDNSGVEYVVLQDEQGILAASRTVEEMSSVGADSVLLQALRQDTVLTRTLEFAGREVFEVVAPHRVDDDLIGLLRVGLSMQELRATEARMLRRALVMTGVLVFIGVLALVAIASGKSYRVLSRQYTSFQSMTGSILEQMGDAVVSISADGRIALLNQQAERLLGMPATIVQGRRLDELGPEHRLLLENVFASRDGLAELELHASDGSVRTVSVSVSQVADAAAGVTRTAVIRDLTESKRAERELSRREKLSAMGELASGLAHEIRNPLNAMSMIAHRLATEFQPTKDSDEYLHLSRVLKSEIGRVSRDLQRFLEFARPQKPNLAPVGLGSFLAHVGAIFGAQAKQKGVDFSVSCETEGSTSLDREQMTQALLNLLQNALDATPPGGSIRLAGEMHSGTAVIRVVDTGSGIPRDKIDTVFNLYYTTKEEGTGMGLSITQQIVSQHGGRITVSSTPGQGSEFTVTIPTGTAS